MSRTLAIWVLAWWIATPVACSAWQWDDATGKYKMEADLVAFNATTVVLKKGGRELVEVPAKKLSKEDQEYLKSKEAEMVSLRAADQVQTWTLRDGTRVIGNVVGYGRKEITIQRRRGRVYVSDQPLSKLHHVCQATLAKIVAHFDKVPIEGAGGLEQWALKAERGAPHIHLGRRDFGTGERRGVPDPLLSLYGRGDGGSSARLGAVAGRREGQSPTGTRELARSVPGASLSAGPPGEPADRHDPVGDAGL